MHEDLLPQFFLNGERVEAPGSLVIGEQSNCSTSTMDILVRKSASDSVATLNTSV